MSLSTSPPPRKDASPKQSSEDLKTFRALSVPVLAGTLVVIAAGGAGLYFWHSYQVQRGAGKLLERAEQLAKDAETGGTEAGYSEAASLFYRAAQIHPNDPEAQIRLAEVYEKTATDAKRAERAIALLYEALVVADATRQQQLRRRLIELLLKQRQYLEAETEARKLTAAKEDTEGKFQAARLLALALLGRYQSSVISGPEQVTLVASLIDQLRTATGIKAEPQTSEILAHLLRSDDPHFVVFPVKQTSSGAGEPGGSEGADVAAALTKDQRIQEADALVARLTEQCPDDPLAWLASYNYRTVHAMPGAADDLRRALEVGSQEVEVRLAVADAAYSAARDLMNKNRLIALPDSADAQDTSAVGLAAAAVEARQQLEAAVEHYQFVLDHIEQKNANAILGLGRAQISLGQSEKAVKLWQDALADPDTDRPAIRYCLTQQLLNDRDYNLAGTHLNALEKVIERMARVRSDRARLAPLKRSLDLMRGKVFVGTEEPLEALRRLESATTGQPASPTEAVEHFQAHCLAAACQRKLGRHDLTAQSFEKASEVAPDPADKAASSLSAAAAWKDAGAIENAIANCQRAINLHQSPEAYLLLAQLLMAQQQMLPSGERNWSRYDEAMKSLRDAAGTGELKQSWRFELLEADGNLAQAMDDPQQADNAGQNMYRVARSAEERFPTEETLLRQLVLIYQRLDKPEDADRALKGFQAQTADAAARQLIEADLHFERKDFEAASAALRSMGANLSQADHIQVEKTRAKIAAAAGRGREAFKILKLLAAKYPDDLGIARMRWQVVDQMDDSQARDELEQDLLKGNQDDWAMARTIQRSLAEAASERDTKYQEADRLLGRLQAARPNWSLVYSLRGEMTEKRSSFAATKEQQRLILADAARAYERAVSLGDQTLSVYERWISALYRTGQYQAVSRHLARIERAVPLSSVLTEIALNIAFQEDRQDKALALAGQAAAARPKDVMAQVSYAMLLLGAQQADKAQQVLSDTVKAAPKDDRAWNGLFTFYLRTNNQEKARETFDQMMEQATIARDRRAFVLAQGYEALDDFQNAETAYREAIKESPDEERQNVELRLARFYVSHLREPGANCQAKSIELLRNIVARGTADRQAVRMLELLQANEGGEQWEELVAKWNTVQADESVTALDQRFRGALLFQRGGDENLENARKIFESLGDSADSEPNDRLMLARIAERQGDAQAARTHYARLAAQSPPDLSALAYYIDFLIRQNDLDEASRQLQTLTAARQSTFDLGVLELQARLLIAQGNGAQVQELIDPPSLQRLASLENGDAAAKYSLLGSVGNAYTRLGLHGLAETWYRRLVDGAPNQFALLAVCLARQNRMKEALDLCEDAWARLDPASACQTLADVLTASRPSLEDYERAEPILAEAEQKFGDKPIVLQKISNVRIVQGKIDDAIRLLEQTVKLDDKNALALNNLAVMMSEQPARRADALRYIDKAIAITGPRADLYDTKGSIILYEIFDDTHSDEAIRQTQLDEAIDLLKFAVRMDKKDPRFRFHLAAGYFGTRNMEQAAEYLRDAIQDGLENEILTEPDRKLMVQMRGLLDAPTPESPSAPE